MTKTILLTSFNIWKPHHTSNSSDDLFEEMMARNLLPEGAHLLRKLPVDFELAPKQAIAKINELNPQLIVCCGMAEKRELLTVESNGKHQEEVIKTDIDVDRLVENLEFTQVSYDAGKFVCNYFYYAILNHIQMNQLNSQCIFVHVPVLNPTNLISILKDFTMILGITIESIP